MSDHFAKEAQRLLDDEVLRQAFQIVRQDALEALSIADAGDITAVLRLQAHVAAVEQVRSALNAAILRQGTPEEKASPFA